MLIAQAINKSLILISRDTQFDAYYLQQVKEGKIHSINELWDSIDV